MIYSGFSSKDLINLRQSKIEEIDELKDEIRWLDYGVEEIERVLESRGIDVYNSKEETQKA